MRRVVLFLLAVSLFSGVTALITVPMNESKVGEEIDLPSIDGTREKVEIASGSQLPKHFVLKDGKIKLTDSKGADYENKDLRRFTFKVKVTDKVSNKFREEVVVINILDVNDEPPVITGPFMPKQPSPYTTGLPQNLTGLFYQNDQTLDGAFIYCLTAKDPDANAKLSYSFSPTDEKYLEVIKKNFTVVGVGCIVRKGNTPLEASTKTYRFYVRATDLNSDHPDKASTDVRVDASVAFQPPQIAATPYIIQFYEKTPKNAIIGYIYAVQMHNRANQLQYKITEMSASSNIDWPFTVDSNTGAVTLTDDTNTALYNRVCRQQWHAKLTVTEVGSPATEKSSSTLLIIQLMDKNNFSPFFEHGIHFAKVAENIDPTKEIMQINVVDPDSTSNKDLTYTLEGADEKYFKVTKSPDGPFFSAIIKARQDPKLDFEDAGRTNHLYNFELVAFDGAFPKQRTSVIVEVTNTNDELPKFNVETETVNVNRKVENLPVIIYQVQANDPDGSTVKYNFQSTGSTTAEEFEVDPFNGVIKYKKEAAISVAKRDLLITAEDQGDCSLCPPGSKQKSKQNFKLTVNFVDPNTHAPYFVDCPATINIKEEQPKGSSINVKLTALDKDQGTSNGRITYSLKKNEYTTNPSAYVEIDPNTGKMKTARIFDREDDSANYWSVWITVQASDSGPDETTRLYATCTMHLIVEDVNDKKPVFKAPNNEPPIFFVVMMAKPYASGARIMTVFAHDADQFDTKNSRIEYGVDSDGFAKIDPVKEPGTGAIITFKTATTLDIKERVKTITVTATDQGTPPMAATASVKILVTNDEKDLPPTVTLTEEPLLKPENIVLENTPGGTPLYQITATHTSSTLNIYNMNGDSAATNKGGNSITKIDSGGKTTLNIANVFNAAKLNHVYYMATVELTRKITIEKKKYPIYSLINILFKISDVNNKVPHFITFNSQKAVIPVPENVAFVRKSETEKNPIAKLFAADRDVKLEFRTVTLTLKEKEQHDKFEFKDNELFISQKIEKFDFEATDSYKLEVVARDNAASAIPGVTGNNEQVVRLTVQVKDVNDRPPKFAQAKYTASVSENAKINDPVFTLKADDKDTVSQNSLTYSIEGQNPSSSSQPPFGVHTTTGQIYVAKFLNYEKAASYTLTCKVFDGLFSATTKLVITVINVIDEPPKFDKPEYVLPKFTLPAAGNPFVQPTNWPEVTVEDPDKMVASKDIKVTAFGKWITEKKYFGIERVAVGSAKWKFLVKTPPSMEPWKTTETLDRQYRFMLKAEKKSGTKTLVSYARVKVGPVLKASASPLCFKPGTLLGWPKVGDQTALTLSALNPDDPTSASGLQFTVADADKAKYEIKENKKVAFKSPTTATGPNTITSLSVTVKDPSAKKELTSRAFVMVQPKSTTPPRCISTKVKIPSTTKIKEEFFLLRLIDDDEADRGKLTFKTTLSTPEYFKLTLRKNIDAVGFSLMKSVVKETTFKPITVTVEDSDKKSSDCTINFEWDEKHVGLKMTVKDAKDSIDENDNTGLPRKIATVTVEFDPPSIVPPEIPDADISITNETYPGLELVKKTKNTAELFITKPLDREALTTGKEDAKVTVNLQGKVVKGTPLPTADTTFELTVKDVDETPNITPMTASVLTTSTPQTVSPAFTVSDGDTKANQGSYEVAVTGSSSALFDAKKTSTGFTLATKSGADFSKQPNPLFVPVKITEGTLTKTMTIKIFLTDNKLTDTNREVNAVVSTGWHWYWMPSIAKVSLGNIYGKILTPDIMSGLTFDIPDNKFWYPSYFTLDQKTGMLSIIGAVPAGVYTVVGRAKRGSETAKATVRIQVRVASNQAVQHSATMRINGLDAQHLVLRQKKAGTSGASATDFDSSILTKIQDILAKKLQTEAKKVVILSAQDFRDSKGAPYVEVLYAASGSPYMTPEKLQVASKEAKADIKKIVPATVTVDAPIDRCSTSETTCPYGCVNRIRVDEKDKDSTVVASASYIGLKVSIQAVCGCQFKPDYPPPDCSINACLNDGKCSLAPGTVNARCECPKGLGLIGPRCQKLDVNFNTRTGYVMTESIGSCSDLHISFEFLSTAPTTKEILLYAGPGDGETGDHLMVGLEDKKPYVQVRSKKDDPKDDPKVKNLIKESIDTPVTKDKWHRLDVFYKRNGQNDDYLEIMIDRCRNGVDLKAKDGVKDLDRKKCSKRLAFTGNEPAINRRIDVSAFPLQVGGCNLKLCDNSGLVGSIRRVRVNSKLRNLLVAPQGLSRAADDNKALNATCYASDGKPKCGENAVCRPGGEKLVCKCLPGYRQDDVGVCSVKTKIMDYKKEGFSFWKLKTTTPVSRELTWASIRFRTRRTFGTLLYFTSADGYRNQSVELRIQKSRVQVVFNLGDYSFEQITLPNTNVSDGDWHSVEMERVLNEFEITLDDGEYGNYILFRKGPTNKFNFLTLSHEFLAGLRWQRKYSNLLHIEYFFSDLDNTCLTDVRWNDEWVPMLAVDDGDEGAKAKAKAVVAQQKNLQQGCANPKHCVNAPACPAPLTCVPEIWRPLTIPACACAVGSALSWAGKSSVCVALGVCYPNPCRAGTCELVSTSKRGYKCNCLKGYAGDNCEVALVATAGLGPGLIVLIVLLLLLILLAVLFYVYFVKCRRRDEKLLADPDDYTRENITPYDEEGAGEEDHDHYDLTFLRKPVMDIRPVKSVPLGAAPHRPSDLGNFLDGRLQDAENDPHGPPQDYSLDYGYEGQGSVVEDLSSLGSGTSDGSQQYDHLHSLGPKFRPLHDLYNHQRNV